nr:hypothetical protein GCM10020092_046020 [Actinoplanes digitatis]
MVPHAAEPCGPSPITALVTIPDRTVPMPVSPARVMDPSSSGFGGRATVVTVSGSSWPRTRIAAFCAAPVPKFLISWADAGLSLEPRVPSGSFSSTTTAAAAALAAAAGVPARAFRRAAAFADACFFRYVAQPL